MTANGMKGAAQQAILTTLGTGQMSTAALNRGKRRADAGVSAAIQR